MSRPVDDVLCASAMLRDAFAAMAAEAKALGYGVLHSQRGLWVSLGAPTRSQRNELLTWCMDGDPVALPGIQAARKVLEVHELRDLASLLRRLEADHREAILAEAEWHDQRAAQLRGDA